MKYKFLGDRNWLDYGGKWVSPKQNNGNFDYWLVIELINMDNACGEDNAGKPKYYVFVSAVSPSEAGRENVEKAFGDGAFNGNPLAQVEALHAYGVYASMQDYSGNNARKLLRQAKRDGQAHVGLFGFFMDNAKNGIGSTGWDCIKGDIVAGLKRLS